MMSENVKAVFVRRFSAYFLLGALGFFNLVAFMNCGQFRPTIGDLENASGGLQPNLSRPPTPSGGSSSPSLGPLPSNSPSGALPPVSVAPPPPVSLAPPPPDQAFCSTSVCLSPQTPTARGTFYSIGIELPVTGDTDHDATAEVRYRPSQETAWRLGFPLVRMDMTSINSRVTNALNGSLFNLTPGTAYVIHLIVRDPDGGVKNYEFNAATRAFPIKPTSGRVLHVRPGTGTGDGSSGNPFRTIEQADNAAQPGDQIMLHAGSYTGDLTTGYISFRKSGRADSFISYIAAGDGEVTFIHTDIYASYIWLEGITFRNQPFAMVGKRDSQSRDVVIKRCRFLENHYSIHFQGAGAGSGWWIVDNFIDGDNNTMNQSFDGEGIELNMTSDHTVMNNTITQVGDGVSYPGANVDILWNDIYNVTDDLIEMDNGLANVRVVENRLHNGGNNGFSFQPQESGPWYLIRNQMLGLRESWAKFRQTDRFVLLHNTIVGWAHIDMSNEDSWGGGLNNLTAAIAKNNLFIVATSGKPMAFSNANDVRFNWRSALDYNGYEWGSEANPFRYATVSYSSIAAFAGATGMETHGVRVRKEDCFETLGLTGPVPTPAASVHLTLKAGCQAVDAGVRLPGINDVFGGAAPDLGAYERGGVVPLVGVRP